MTKYGMKDPVYCWYNSKPYKDKTAKLKQGQAIFFASWLQHRVKPVTRGERKSLVMWFGGPSFK